MYAWTGNVNAIAVTFYTTEQNPTSSSLLYDEDGNVITGTTIYGSTQINSIISCDGTSLTLDYTDMRP